MKGRATGLTLAFTVVLAVGLSFAPLPDAWRPIPALAGEDPANAVAQMLIPQRKTGFGQKDAITGAPLIATEEVPADILPPDESLLLLEEDPVEVAQTEALLHGDGAAIPLTPQATLGAAEAREVRVLERLARRVGAQHVDLELTANLEPFFGKLEALQRGELQEKVRVVHLGDSQIASDHITDVIRQRMEVRYGAGGPGFLFVDRPSRGAGRKVRTGEATDGWDITKLTDKKRPGQFGFSGVRYTANRSKQTSRFAVRGATSAELFFVGAPSGGEVELAADGAALQRVSTRFDEQALGFTQVSLPKGAKTLSLQSVAGEVSLLGVALENDRPGVVYDTVGLPGALFEVYLRAPEGGFITQLQRRDPSLVVLMLGGNEAYEIGRKWQTLETARKNAVALVDRVKAAAPEASCLMVAPMDAAVRTVSGDLEPRPNTAAVGEMIREVAEAKGCAFWDLYKAMGGDRSVGRWLAAGLFNQDLVHPRARGADVLGHLFDFALERARLSREGAAAASGFVEQPGLLDPSGKALSRVAQKLSSRPVFVQLGASHTAGHMFTDVVRADLQKAHGNGGRGYVSAGRSSERLLPAKVKRSLEGAWEIPDARERGPGEPWSLSGTRAVGQKGAKLSIAFGVGERAGAEPSALTLHYLKTPDMGRMKVRIDGVEVADLGPPSLATPGGAAVEPAAAGGLTGMGSARGEARIERFEVKGLSHVIEVENLGPGPVTVFGAALERTDKGLVYDAVGLPGSTVLLADGYDKESFAAQLRARAPDAYVVFYGTNESALSELDPQILRQHYTSFLETLKGAAPEADCVLMGPTDLLAPGADGTVVAAPGTDRVIRTIREVAYSQGCAFWSARAAMGGKLSMRRWQTLRPPLGHEDGVHLTAEGYERLAHAFADDLAAALRASGREE